MHVSSHEDSVGESCCAGSILSMKLSGFMIKTIKLLLTELVGQYRNILPLVFSALTSLRYYFFNEIVRIYDQGNKALIN